MRTGIDSPFRRQESSLVPPLWGERAALLVVDMQYFDAHTEWGEGKTARGLGVLHAVLATADVIGALRGADRAGVGGIAGGPPVR